MKNTKNILPALTFSLIGLLSLSAVAETNDPQISCVVNETSLGDYENLQQHTEHFPISKGKPAHAPIHFNLLRNFDGDLFATYLHNHDLVEVSVEMTDLETGVHTTSIMTVDAKAVLDSKSDQLVVFSRKNKDGIGLICNVKS